MTLYSVIIQVGSMQVHYEPARNSLRGNQLTLHLHVSHSELRATHLHHVDTTLENHTAGSS